MTRVWRKFFFMVCCWLYALTAHAAISVTSGSAATLLGNGSLTVTTPSAFVGDVLIVQISAPSTATIAASGWTAIGTAGGSVTGVQQRLYYLNLVLLPSSTYSFTISGNSSKYSTAVIYAVHGATAANCGTGTGSANNTSACAGASQSGGGSQITAPNVQSSSTYAAGSLQMAFFADASASAPITLPSGLTAGTASSTPTGTTGVSMNAGYTLMTSASSGTSQTASISTSANNVGSTVILTASSLALTCISDNFNRTTGLGSNWVTTVINGSFTPAITSNRLRLTDTGTKESTAVSFQRLFPGASNYVQMLFKYYGYNGTGADGIAVILSDATVTPQPGGFGGSLGYAPKASTSSAGFAGGWMGLGLDEFGNFSNRTDSGACAPTVTSCATSAVSQSVSIRGSSPNYYWLRGTGTLGTSVSNSTGHLYRVTIDSRVANQALMTVERDTTGNGTSFSTLISSFNIASASSQASIPANFLLSLTGSTGDSTNIHEIDDLQICAQYMNAMTTIDHYELTTSSDAYTCAPETVTVKACTDSAVPCTTPYTGSVTTTLTPTSGWTSGNSLTFTGGSTTASLSETTAASYTLGISSSNPPFKAFTTTNAYCNFNGAGWSSTCSLPFKDSGFVVTVPTQTSGVTSSSTASTLGTVVPQTECVAAFKSQQRNVALWYNYSNPTSASTLSNPFTLYALNSGSVASTNTLGTTQPSTTIPLYFDANGVASIAVKYMDAGQLTLNAAYTGSTTTSDAGLSMTGAGSFVTVPYGLCVDSTDSGWNSCSTTLSTWPSCSKYRQAGQAFALRVTGKAYSSSASSVCSMATTPNYIESGISLTSAFADTTVTGYNSGSLGTATISVASSGTATLTNETESDIGVFKISAAGNYFSLGKGPTGSGVFGRFYPAGFLVSSAGITNRSDLSACSSSAFTYLGEPVTSAFTLSAVNASGVVTPNYHDTLAFLSLTPAAYNATSGLIFGAQDTNTTTNLNARVTPACSTSGTACGVWSSGSASMSAKLTVARNTTGVDGPFASAKYVVKATDSDGVGIYGATMAYTIGSGTTDAASLGTSVLRYGRVRVENAYGSPLLALPVPSYAQYYNGAVFVKNTDDSCTQITVPTSATIPTSTTLSSVLCNGGVGLYSPLTGVTATMGGVAAGNTATLGKGDANLILSKPGSNSSGYLDMALSVPTYLQYNWNGKGTTECSGGTLYGQNPRARVRFGIKSNKAMIYLREVY